MPGKRETYIFYHAPCLDGMAARLVADRFFGADAVYEGCGHAPGDQPYRSVPENSEIYFLDYAPDKDGLLNLLEQPSSDVVVLDHHLSSINSIGNIEHERLETVLNLQKSGVGLSWDYFFPGKARPLFIDIIEAIDLNRISYFENTDQFYTIAAYFDALPLDDFSSFVAKINDIEQMSLAAIEQAGRPYRHNNQQKILRDCSAAQNVTLKDGNIAVLIHADFYQHSREFVPFVRAHHKTDAVLVWWKEGADQYRINIHTSDPRLTAQDILIYLKNITHCKGGGHQHSTVARMTKAQFDAFRARLDWDISKI